MMKKEPKEPLEPKSSYLEDFMLSDDFKCSIVKRGVGIDFFCGFFRRNQVYFKWDTF